MSIGYRSCASGGIALLMLAALVVPRGGQGQPATQPVMVPPERVERTVLIAAPIQRVWEALVDQKISDDWFAYPMALAELKAGGRLVYGTVESPAVILELTRYEPPNRLQGRLRIRVGSERLQAEPPTQMTFELSAIGPSTALRLVQDEMRDSPETAWSSARVWDTNLSKLKTRLETGRRLPLSYEEARRMEEQADGQSPTTRPSYTNPLAYPRQFTLYVENMKQARPWFEKVFDLPLSGFSIDWITFDMANPRIQIKQAKAGESKPGDVQVAYYAQDVDRLYQRLQGLGVQFLKPLTDLKLVKEFVFVSPDGHQFWVQGPANQSGQ